MCKTVRTGSKLDEIKFEKVRLSVTADDAGEMFVVRHGQTIYISPAAMDLALYLTALPR